MPKKKQIEEVKPVIEEKVLTATEVLLNKAPDGDYFAIVGYKLPEGDDILMDLDLENADLGKCLVLLEKAATYIGIELNDVTYKETIDSHMTYVEVFMGRKIEAILGKRQDPAIHIFTI